MTQEAVCLLQTGFAAALVVKEHKYLRDDVVTLMQTKKEKYPHVILNITEVAHSSSTMMRKCITLQRSIIKYCEVLL